MNQQESEIHLFIIWEKARYQEKKILNDIEMKFTILKIFEITWTKKLFSENLSRFYGTKLPPGSSKESHCGTGPFLLVIVKDHNPSYGSHDTSKGIKKVNNRVFTSKSLHREWTGGGHRIHATNSVRETEHDLVLLTGLNSEDFLRKYTTPSVAIEKVKQDLFGARGWKNVEEFFYALNSCEKYVVLRNFDVLPSNYYSEKHGDIDLLVKNLEDTVYSTNAKAVFQEDYRVHYKIRISDEDVLFDFRWAGDDYYDQKWENDILRNRIFNKGFYTPSTEDHFYSLLYHGLIHKPAFADDYINNLKLISRQNKFSLRPEHVANVYKSLNSLASFMVKNQYNYIRPKDASVFINDNNLEIAIKLIKRKKLQSPRFILKKLAARL